MTEHPLNCDARTALAIYEGRQTQDRRPLTKRRAVCDSAAFDSLDFSVARLDGGGAYLHAYRVEDDTWHRVFSRIQPRDVVWIREAHYVCDCGATWDTPGEPLPLDTDYAIAYWASDDGDELSECMWHTAPQGSDALAVDEERLRASIHMPRWACRSLRRVTRVWFERFQDISANDAIAEGFLCAGDSGTEFSGRVRAVSAFRKELEAIYPGAWDENGWVVAIEFEEAASA